MISTTIRSTRGKGCLCTSSKDQARRYLRDKNANWTVTKVARGRGFRIQLTRIS